MTTVSIISDIRSERLSYICDVIFSGLLGVAHEIVPFGTTENDNIQILYTPKDTRNKNQSHIIWIPRSTLISETDIRSLNVNVVQLDGLPALIFDENRREVEGGGGSGFEFDLLAMVFYLVSRYEEYEITEGRGQNTDSTPKTKNLPFGLQKDRYGRYASGQSIAAKAGFLQLPLVDLWVARLAERINQRCQSDLAITEQGSNEMTLDIDMPYAYHHKGWKAYAGILKDLAKGQLTNVKARVAYLTQGLDPFDTYDWIKAQCAQRYIKPKFFILNKYQKPHDENHLANTEHLYDIVRELSHWSDIGIHPSFSAGTDMSEVKKELNQLESGIKKKITNSRQHFLMVTLPNTYSTLIECGVKDDYSMGYPDQMGFRASTARPFLWYDLVSEKTTDLTIHPCITMDVTMRYYQHLSPAEAIAACDDLIAICKEVSGCFSVIWHNSSLSDAYGWGPWKEVFIHLLNNTTQQPYGDS